MKIDGVNFSVIEKEYINTPDPMYDRTPLCTLVSNLPLADRRFIILYAELGSTQKLANELKVSRFVVRERLYAIQALLRKQYLMPKLIKAIYNKALDDIETYQGIHYPDISPKEKAEWFAHPERFPEPIANYLKQKA